MKRAKMSQAALGVLTGRQSAKVPQAAAPLAEDRIKTTLYLDAESYRLLEKVRYERRSAGDRKIDFSALVREALKSAFHG